MYHAVHNPDLFEWAVELIKTAIKSFKDEEGGGFFDAAADKNLPVRIKNEYDGAEPAANSVMVMNLVRLSRLTSNKGWLELAAATIDAFADRINSHPLGLAQMLSAHIFLKRKTVYIVVAGFRDREDTHLMLAVCHRHYCPEQVVLPADGGDN